MGSNPTGSTDGPVAQLEAASDSKSVQCRFESDRDYKIRKLSWVALCIRLIRIERLYASVA